MARHDISYDFEDFAMTPEELEAKYPDGHPEYTREQWAKIGIGTYWDWVANLIRADDDAMPSTLEEELGTVEVQDLDQFVRMLADWHSRQIAQLKHMQNVPEGTPVDIDDKEHVLSGDMRTGFIAGLTVALSLLGELPFVAEVESVPEQGNAT